MITLHFVYIASCRFTRFIRTLVSLGAILGFIGLAVAGRPNPHASAAGFAPTIQFARVHGQVWNDLNHDGIHQTPEPGMPGVTVTLYITGAVTIATTFTTSTGHYTFTQLQPATYTLGYRAPVNFSFTLFGLGADPDVKDNLAHADGRTDPIALEADATPTVVNAGVWKSALVSSESSTAQQQPIFLPFIAAAK